MRFTHLSRHGLSITGFAVATAFSVAAVQPAAAAPDAAPLIWSFDKCAVADGAWQGTAQGPTGSPELLETRLTGLRQSDSVLHVDFDWQVGEAYLAQLTGTLNLKTGAVVMNGQVAEGQYAGSRVHEEGQLYDAENSCFAGTIQVLPATG